MSSGPDTEQPQQLGVQRAALARPCPVHDTPPGLPCLNSHGAICPERISPPQVDLALRDFYIGVEAAMAVLRTVEACGGSLEQARQHVADLGATRRAHEPGG